MRTAERLKKCGINNVSLIEVDAFVVDKLNICQQDIIIANSVVQYFPGYNYFILAMKKMLSCMKDTGVIYRRCSWFGKDGHTEGRTEAFRNERE